MEMITISRTLADAVDALAFAAPVACVYNPLVYARAPHEQYLARYGAGPKEMLWLGMNPGPFGMAQTGVPFGDAGMVRDWLGIEAAVGRPPREHPKRPVEGFACRRGEVSGRRLWGWARARFDTPARFFARCFVANYCPLAFLDDGGRNLTPDTLPAAERRRLYAPCDEALRRTVAVLRPRVAIGIGHFATARLREALAGVEIRIETILHPSPANPQANAGWDAQVDAKLRQLELL